MRLRASPWSSAAALAGVMGLSYLAARAANAQPAPPPSARGAAATQPAPAATRPGDHAFTLRVGGRDRRYLVHVPRAALSAVGAAPASGWPVVLAFHGAAMDAEAMVHFSGLNAKADAAGFLAVYPDGTGGPLAPRLLTWNAGDCCGASATDAVDDAAFVRALLDALAGDYRVDPRRVFATGMSNGAMMCYRLAAELPDRIAAIAPVAGTMAMTLPLPGPGPGAEHAARAEAARAVPVLHFHGTADRLVSYPFGRAAARGGSFRSVPDTVRAWAAADGCPPTPRDETLTVAGGPDDATRVIRHAYGPGRDGAEVVLYEIVEGGHTWPGRPMPLPWLGKVAAGLRANDLMWEFFEKHPMPEGGRIAATVDGPSPR